LDAAERHRRDLANGGTVWNRDRYSSPRTFGFWVLVLGLAFIAASYAAI
jgi:hypothetical protein